MYMLFKLQYLIFKYKYERYLRNRVIADPNKFIGPVSVRKTEW